MSIHVTAPITRSLGLDRNPLRRVSDRLQSIALMIVLIGVVAAIPVGVHVGQRSFESGTARAAAQAAALHRVTAVLLEDSAITTRGTSSKVRAVWRGPDGRMMGGNIDALQDGLAGSRVTIWVTKHGEARPAPPNAADVRIGSIMAGTAAYAGVLILLTALYLALVSGLNQIRFTRWAQAWKEVSPQWRY